MGRKVALADSCLVAIFIAPVRLRIPFDAFLILAAGGPLSVWILQNRRAKGIKKLGPKIVLATGSEITLIPHSLLGTSSVLANALVRFACFTRMMGPIRTVVQLADHLKYCTRRWKAVVPEDQGLHVPRLDVCSWLRNLDDIKLVKKTVTSDQLASFFSDVHYPRYYYEGSRRVRYGLWHMIGFELCKLERSDTVIDIGAQTGVWGRIARRRYGCKVFDVDIQYAPGIHSNKVGAEASSIPLPSASVSHIVSFCAFNCFEDMSDILFLREATRLLVPGGKLVIVPLCVAEEYVNLYDPAACTPSESFDSEARLVPRPGWKVRFGRWYDYRAFVKRIEVNITSFTKEIWHVCYPAWQGCQPPEFYAALFRKKT